MILIRNYVHLCDNRPKLLHIFFCFGKSTYNCNCTKQQNKSFDYGFFFLLLFLLLFLILKKWNKNVFDANYAELFTTMSRNNSMEIYTVKVEILEILFIVRCLQFISRHSLCTQEKPININSPWLTLFLVVVVLI